MVNCSWNKWRTLDFSNAHLVLPLCAFIRCYFRCFIQSLPKCSCHNFPNETTRIESKPCQINLFSWNAWQIEFCCVFLWLCPRQPKQTRDSFVKLKLFVQIMGELLLISSLLHVVFVSNESHFRRKNGEHNIIGLELELDVLEQNLIHITLMNVTHEFMDLFSLHSCYFSRKFDTAQPPNFPFVLIQ